MKFKFAPLTIAKRLWLSLVTLSILPIVLMGYGFLELFQQSLISQATSEVAGLADKKANQISEHLNQQVANILLLAKIPTVVTDIKTFSKLFEQREGEAYKVFEASRREFYADLVKLPGYHDLFFVDLLGTIVFTIAHEQDFSTNLRTGSYRTSQLAQVVRQAEMATGAQVSNMAFYEPSNEPAVFLAAPVVENERLVGVIALQINTEQFNAVVGDNTGLGNSGETVAAHKDGEGALFLTPLKFDPEAALKRRVNFSSPLAKPVQEAVRGKSGEGIFLDYRGEEVVAAWRYIPGLRMGMVVKVDTAEALSEVRTMRQRGLWAVGVMLLLVSGSGLVFYRSIVPPLHSLTDAAREIAKGFMDRRAAVVGGDEISQLAIAFNTMADTVQKAHMNLEERVLERTQALSLANERLHLAGIVFENTSEAVVVTDADSRILEVNDAFCRVTGYEREEMIGQNPSKNKSGRHDAGFYQDMWRTLQEIGHWSGEIWDRRKCGEIYPKWLSISAVRNHGGAISHYVGIFSDITGQKKTEAELERLAFYDALTGLPNRALFHNRLKMATMTAGWNGKKIALMFIDLDRFKWVNDTLGHAAGDELLINIAGRIVNSVRPSDIVARLGGDEFTVIISEMDRPEKICSMGQHIIQAVKEPIEIRGRTVHLGASVGVAIYPDDGIDMDTLAKHADLAMYKAKEKGRNNCQFFSSDVHALVFDRIAMEDDLHKGLARKEFTLFYQPKVDTQTRRIVGMEALIRWFKPAGGMVSPAQFIPLAEETGLILPLGRGVLETACGQTAAWNTILSHPLKVAVNLSARQFNHDGIVDMVREIINLSGLRPEQLELEITESMVMGGIEEVIAKMHQLRDLGISLAIDDFGTGFSSLSYLKRFPINTLKIDQSFVCDLMENSDDAAIVDAIIALAQSMRLTVVAEGVERPDQLAYLQQRGCQQVQGYYFSRPLPATEFEAFVAKQGMG